jgi:lysophospholipase L1-like esterase
MKISQRATNGGLALVGLVAIVVAIGMGKAAVDYFDMSEAIRLDPAGLKVYAASPPAAVPPGGRVVEFFGDSRSLMWTAPAGLAGYTVVDRGIGRQTTAQILLRFDADVLSLHPAVLVLEAGVNDLKTIAAFPEKRAEIVADCEANLKDLVDRSTSAGARVVLVTVFDIGHVPLWRKPFWSPEVEAAVRDVNAYLPSLTGPRVVLFDANAVLEASPGEIRPEYQLDHLHLTAAGYGALNEKLVPLLASLPSDPPAAPPR